MSTTKQLLQIDPHNELLFRGPFHLPSAAFVRLTNGSDKSVVFKIKTTAPKKYCVRPNAGILLPSNHTDIVLSLQPFSYDPLEKNKHKFLVQSAVVVDGENANLEQIWRKIPTSDIFETKLKCVFEVPQECKIDSEVNTSLAEDTNSANTLQNASREVQYLRKEGIQMKEENVRLKEEIDYLRRDIQDSITSPPSTVSIKTETRIPLAVVVSEMLLGVIGFLFGKYVI